MKIKKKIKYNSKMRGYFYFLSKKIDFYKINRGLLIKKCKKMKLPPVK
jgi:hypothetical protein